MVEWPAATSLLATWLDLERPVLTQDMLAFLLQDPLHARALVQFITRVSRGGRDHAAPHRRQSDAGALRLSYNAMRLLSTRDLPYATAEQRSARDALLGSLSGLLFVSLLEGFCDDLSSAHLPHVCQVLSVLLKERPGMVKAALLFADEVDEKERRRRKRRKRRRKGGASKRSGSSSSSSVSTAVTGAASASASAAAAAAASAATRRRFPLASVRALLDHALGHVSLPCVAQLFAQLAEVAIPANLRRAQPMMSAGGMIDYFGVFGSLTLGGGMSLPGDFSSSDISSWGGAGSAYANGGDGGGDGGAADDIAKGPLRAYTYASTSSSSAAANRVAAAAATAAAAAAVGSDCGFVSERLDEGDDEFDDFSASAMSGDGFGGPRAKEEEEEDDDDNVDDGEEEERDPRWDFMEFLCSYELVPKLLAAVAAADAPRDPHHLGGACLTYLIFYCCCCCCCCF